MTSVSFDELFGDDPHSFHHRASGPKRMRPLIILGFGRSGTTWLADIFSRVYGGLVLFEPLHPSVTDSSRAFAYRRELSDSDSEWLARHLRNVLDGHIHKPWLLRNHLPERIENVSPDLFAQIWAECPVIGFKDIRMNLMIPWLVEQQLGQVVFITRSEDDIVASILARSNFYEFGWPETYLLAAEHLMIAPWHIADVAGCLRQWVRRTLALALADCKRYAVPVVSYEALRQSPFKTMRSLIEMCGLPLRPLHPSHVLLQSLSWGVNNR